MRIVATRRVVDDYGARIREADPAADFIVPGVRDGDLVWDGDPTAVDVVCFSEDMWQELALRQLVIPAVFRLDGLRWFHTFSAGVDNAAFQVLIDRGAILTNSSGASAPSIAQYVLAMMLARAKPLAAWRAQQAAREWKQIPSGELTGQTCGIIGTGAIGGEVARLARALNMRTIGARRSNVFTPLVDEQLPMSELDHLLAESDYVVVACPLTKETEGLIGERELRLMKPSATLINVARGRVVVEQALIAALREGWIAAACLDVFEEEPLPPESPLWEMPNVAISPHNSGFSPLNMDRAMSIFIENLGRLVRGEDMRNRVLRAGVG